MSPGTIFLSTFLCLALSNLCVSSEARSFFVFGDSLVDNGNNDFLLTTARADAPPYGIDFPTHKPTGRFSNGLNIPDIISENTGAESPMPYLHPFLHGERLLVGANFASAGIGILNDTGSQFLNIIRIYKQLEYFEQYQQRVSALIGAADTRRLVNQALVLISLGGNDFVNNYYLVPYSARSRQFALPDYVGYLISEYRKVLLRFYEFGAKKVLVTGTGPMGCVPAELALRSRDGNCDVELNRAAALYNPQLVEMLGQLNNQIGSDVFISANAFNIHMDFISNPQAYEFYGGISLVQAWGVDLVKENAPSPETVEYIGFLLATAAGKVEGEKVPSKIATPFEKTKIAAYTVGAMTPCMRLYAYLGVELQKLVGRDDHEHPFRKWIENYASESFQASDLQVEELLDKLSVSLIGAEIEVIERLYRRAAKLEIQFFYAQPLSRRYLVPLGSTHDPEKERFVIFSDFDLTCTMIDSSAILAEIAILSSPKEETVEPENLNPRISSAELRKSWDALSRQYTEEHEQCIKDIVLDGKGEMIPYTYEKLHSALEQLSEFEKSANVRVTESEVLKGLNLEDIKRAGERLKLQDGCVKFFQQAVQKKDELNSDIHILSYCWCGDLIRSAFKPGGLEVLNIHSNELTYDGTISTGKIGRKVESPADKLNVFLEILNNCGNDKHLSVYIGDSVGDLLCLLQADVGIVVGSSASLKRVGKRFGISFVPLFPGVVYQQREFVNSDTKWPKGVLYTVSSWTEIQAFILGS